MTTKSIPPLDLMFFLTESAASPKHVGGVQIFSLPPDVSDTFLRDLVDDFRRAPVSPPFNFLPHFPSFGMPEWREDENMDVEYHVRHSALPKPGSRIQLMQLVENLHSGLLSRQRPLWFCEIIEGLEDNCFAIYTKIHHSCIDGMSGVKRMSSTLSTSPKDDKVVPLWSWAPDEPSRGSERRPLGERLDTVSRQIKGIGGAAQLFARNAMRLAHLSESDVQPPFAAERTRMNQPLSSDSRSTAVCTLPLDKVKAVSRKLNCTVNELVLTVIGAALDDYLEEYGEFPEDQLVALCPMSIRSEGDDSASARVAAVLVRLGEADADITERLRQVVESSLEAKEDVSDDSPEALLDYTVTLFAMTELMQLSKLDQVIPPSYNVLVSNVPGPTNKSMYLRGARLEANYPLSTLLPGVNLNATVLSHGNNMDFGLMGDKSTLPDLDIVADRIMHYFAKLEAASSA